MATTSLPKLEVVSYFFIWVSALSYMIYCVYLAGRIVEISHAYLLEDSWFGFKRDNSHQGVENFFKFIFFTLSKWLAAHVVLVQLTRWFSPKCIPAVHFLTTMSMICVHFSPLAAVFLLAHAVFFFLILQFNSVSLTWLLSMPFTFIIFDYGLKQFQVEGGDWFSFYLILSSSHWQHLRCTSFVFDQINSKNKPTKTRMNIFYDFIGYCFYLPIYFTGPFILYSNFGPYMYQPYEQFTWKRTGLFVLNLLRILFWAAVYQMTSHFLYLEALQYEFPKVVELGHWTLAGLGILIGGFFQVLLLVIFGFGTTIAGFDGYKPPPLPKCLLHQHLFADVWRLLDIGFYQYMHKYVYQPVCRGRRNLKQRLFASSCCFAFLFMWHGTERYIIIWSCYNWLENTLATIGKTISKSEAYKNWKVRTIGERNSRRALALLIAPIFLLSCAISTFFTCHSYDAGILYLRETFLNGSWMAFGMKIFIYYCVCQVSFEIELWKKNRVQEKTLTDFKSD